MRHGVSGGFDQFGFWKVSFTKGPLWRAKRDVPLVNFVGWRNVLLWLWKEGSLHAG